LLSNKFFVKPGQIVIKSQEPEMIQFQDKVEAGLQEQKMTTKAMKAQLMIVMKEQKRLSDNLVQIVRRQEELAR
jgi:hypothetical protein